MKLLLEHDYIRIEWSSEQKLCVNTWAEKTADMTDAEYRQVALLQVAELEKNKPLRWLVDTAKLNFALAPDTQTWADGLFPRILEAGVKYIAFVISPDIFTQISIEQLMEERNVRTANFEIQYFADTNDAVQWLMSNG